MTDSSLFSNPEKDDQPIDSGQIETLLDMQVKLLGETASSSGDHSKLLDKLCHLAEKLLPESSAAILTFDEHRRQLFIRSAPTLPHEAMIALNGLDLGEGSSGNAVLHNDEMYVCNTREDRRHENLQDFTEYFGIASCWSSPVHNAQQQAMGAFTLYNSEARAPDNFERKVLNTCASAASIIFERERHLRELKHLVDSDSLTGLSNRRKFTEDAEMMFRQVKRSQRRMAIIYLDIDNFKWVNDDYGSDVGDEVLRAVAESLGRNSRDNELACRWGGDAFLLAIVCKDDCQTDVRAMVKRTFRIFSKPISVGKKDVLIEVSCGVGTYPADAQDLDALINRAVLAMFRAKSIKGNQLSFFNTKDVVAMSVGQV